jgi:Xaa-Pro aminopeptidase
MRYQKIPNEFYINNRKILAANLKNDSILVLDSNSIMPSNADGVMGFIQNSDLFYLTGIDQEESKLVLVKSKNTCIEILFIKKTDEHIKIWEGQKLSKEQASEISGIANINWTEEFAESIKEWIVKTNKLYLINDFNEVDTFKSRNSFLRDKLSQVFPKHKLHYINDQIHKQRLIKNESEINQIRKAVEITKKGFMSLIENISNCKYEFEIEAELSYSFLKNRSRSHAFPPIIASGKNACILHYVENNDECKDGDLVLLDFGAEYGNYKADVSRVLPKNGKFSERQKQVYLAVYRIFLFARAQMLVGNSFKNLNKAVIKEVEKELILLGLLSKKEIENQDKECPVYKKFFPHSVSHFLGLDVHDVGKRNTIFQENMVLTCEPGIYIESEGLGIRLENDILIKNTGPVDLCENIPISLEEIEEIFLI